MTDELLDARTWTIHTARRDVASGAAFGITRACRIEAWEPTDAGDLIAPTTNPITSLVPANQRGSTQVTISGRRWPTLTPFATPTPDQVNFPIDVVYTWVDGDDPQWQERKASRMQTLGLAQGDGDTALGHSRFRDHDELRFSIRSLEQFAPWVRHIYLVTDQQVPDWLDTSVEGLTVIDHTELIDDAYRPTFNSHAISARLHRIEGLSEQYLLFNDDVLLGRPVDPRAFFYSNGTMKLFLSTATITPGPAESGDSPLLAARRRTAELIRDAFGAAPTRAFKHTPVPQSREVHHELEERFGQEIEQTLSHPFRDPRDIAVAGWLHHYYAYFSGRAVPDRIAYDYFRITERTAIDRLDRLLRRRNLDCFCLNDAEDGDLSEQERAQALDHFLNAYFPIPSRFEK
jgi:hypothetical protein